MFVFPDGTAKLCCWASGSITEDGVPLSVNDVPLETLWNSGYMREVRRKMLAGEHVEECSLCYDEEKRLNWSYRIASNYQYLPAGQTVEQALDQSRAEGLSVAQAPVFLQLNLGNLCNLKCRMCNSTFSSQIERDPAHSRWAPLAIPTVEGIIGVSQDQGRTSEPLTNSPILQSGFYAVEEHNDRRLQWTNGSGRIRIHGQGDLQGLEISLLPYYPPKNPITILVNGTPVFQGIVPIKGGRGHLRLPANSKPNDWLEIKIESDVFQPPADGRKLGVPVEKIVLLTKPALPILSDPVVGSHSRFRSGEAWYDSREFIFGELLRDPHAIQELYFTGGEPLLNPMVEEILDYLIENHCAGSVRLQFNSNCTKITDEFVDKLSKFAHVKFSLSIDGEGKTYEYIRHPGRWDVVSKNIRKLLPLKMQMTAVPILQIYNALNIVDLCRFCDDLGIAFAIMPLWGPSHLHVGVMPREARMLAAQRLRDYLQNGCRPEYLKNVQTAIDFIETQPDLCTPAMLRTFMLFTNDLDVGRRQNFRETHAELLQLIERTGFRWSQETRHAPAAARA